MTNDLTTATMRSYIFLLIVTGMGLPLPLGAQLGGSPQNTTGTQPAQLPLSGRGASNSSVSVTQTPIPGTTSSVNTLNNSIQPQGPFAGSTTGTRPFSGSLALRDAVARGLEFNLGAVGMNQAVLQAQGQQRVSRSALLPNLNSSLREVVQQTNLRAMGIKISSPIPGFSIPSIVGPFNYFDLRATLTQTVADLTAINNYRSAKEISRASEFTAQDSRDLVVLAVAGSYLQATSAKARALAAGAQVDTAKALYEQTVQRSKSGLLAQIDVNRSLVQLQTQQQRLVTLNNDVAKQKINLARLTGLPPNPNFELADDVPFSAAPVVTVEEALKQAFDRRSDLKAADAQRRAAERVRAAARAERLPSVDVSADYGAIGLNPAQAHGTFTVVGTLRVPIWQGGRVEGNIIQAQSALAQRSAELEDVRGRIESEVRSAFLDLDAAASQVELSRNSQQVARRTLELTKQRYEAGVTDSVEVVQSQESVASADLDYITSLFAHNLAKLTLARAIGIAAESLPLYLKLQ